MMQHKFTGLTVAVVLLSACSSPPEPAAVDWEQPAAAVTTTLPQWEPNNLVIPSPVTTGSWSQYLGHFEPVGVHSAAQWYAVAHASQAVVSAPDSQRYFDAKAWLRAGGYHGLIEFRPRTDCLSCNTTEIFFYR